MLLIQLLVWLVSPGLTQGQTCSPFQEQMRAPLYTDRRLDNYQVSYFTDFTLEECALECFLVTLCKSMNYYHPNGQCELNSIAVANDTRLDPFLEEIAGFDYFELSAWSNLMKRKAGSCETRPCAENQRCIQTTPFTCADVECGPPPKSRYTIGRQQGALTATPEMTSLGSHAYYDCNNDWTSLFAVIDNFEFFEHFYKVCSADNTWSGNDLICYSTLSDCSAFKKCNSDLPDGHYWIIRVEEGRRYKVYCHNMATSSPKMYITLPHADNVAHFGGDDLLEPSTTRYSKIRVTWVSGVALFEVDVRDRTFTTMSGPGRQLHYASGSSCKAKATDPERVAGSFKVNLAGTGFMLDKAHLAMIAVSQDFDDGYRRRHAAKPENLSEEVDFVNITIYTETEMHAICYGKCVSCGISEDTLYLKYGYNLDDDEESNVSYATCV